MATAARFELAYAGIKIQCVYQTSPRRNNQSILYILIKHFTPDLRLANQCSRHIRSMVTIDLCLRERPINNQPPWGISPSRPCETLFPRNFQSIFSKKDVKNLHNFYNLSCIARSFLLLVPPTYVILTFLCLNYDYLVIWHYQQWLLSPQQ